MSSSGSPTPTDDTQPPLKPGPRAGRPATWLTALACLAVAAATPVAASTTAGVDAGFDRTLRQLGGFCAKGPALTCAERFFTLADADADGVLAPAEIDGFKARLQAWTAASQQTLNPTDLRALQVGFLLADTIGIENAMLLYDDDGDGALSFAEATADLNLDGRPLPQLVQQRELVDWPAVRRRFGATAMLFDYLDIR